MQETESLKAHLEKAGLRVAGHVGGGVVGEDAAPGGAAFGARRAVAQLGVAHAERAAADVGAARRERLRLHAQPLQLQLQARPRRRLHRVTCMHRHSHASQECSVLHNKFTVTPCKFAKDAGAHGHHLYN